MSKYLLAKTYQTKTKKGFKKELFKGIKIFLKKKNKKSRIWSRTK